MTLLLGLAEVPDTVDAAQVRVINNVKKQQEVKPNFQEAFKQDGYPNVLPYQQKVRSRHPVLKLVYSASSILSALHGRDYAATCESFSSGTVNLGSGDRCCVCPGC